METTLKYIVTDGIDKRGPFATGKDAALWLIKQISDAIYRGVDPTKWHIEEVDEDAKPKDVPELIPSMAAARQYLVAYGDLYEHRFFLLDKGQHDRVNAFACLDTICKAWNKADGWEPDWKSENEKKFCLLYSHTAKIMHVDYDFNWQSSPFVFKTEERARQFGEKFIDLFRQMYGLEARSDAGGGE